MATVEWAVFAKFGFRDSDHFLCLVTIFDAFALESVPTVIQRCFMAIGVRSDQRGRRNAKLRFRFHPPGGQTIEQEQELELGPEGHVADALIVFNQIPVAAYGPMTVEILMDDEATANKIAKLNLVAPDSAHPADNWRKSAS